MSLLVLCEALLFGGVVALMVYGVIYAAKEREWALAGMFALYLMLIAAVVLIAMGAHQRGHL